MHGHSAAITCLAIASNGLFAVSGSEDKLVLVWGLTVGSAVFTFSVSIRLEVTLSRCAAIMSSEETARSNRSQWTRGDRSGWFQRNGGIEF